MSTLTTSHDRTVSNPLETAGRFAVGFVSIVATVFVGQFYNLTGLIDPTISWHLGNLGVSPLSGLFLAIVLAVVFAPGVAIATYLPSLSDRRELDAPARAAVITTGVVLLTVAYLFWDQGFDVIPELVDVGALEVGRVLVGYFLIITVPILAGVLGVEFAHRISRHHVGVAAIVIVVLVAIPTGVGAIVDAPEDDTHDRTVYGTTTASSGDVALAPADRTRAQELKTTAAEESLDVTLTEYEPARVEQLDGEIAVREVVEGNPKYDQYEVWIDTPESHNQHEVTVGYGAKTPRGDSPAETFFSSPYEEEQYILGPAGADTVVIYFDVVENGEVVRYQTTDDMSEVSE